MLGRISGWVGGRRTYRGDLVVDAELVAEGGGVVGGQVGGGIHCFWLGWVGWMNG